MPPNQVNALFYAPIWVFIHPFAVATSNSWKKKSSTNKSKKSFKKAARGGFFKPLNLNVSPQQLEKDNPFNPAPFVPYFTPVIPDKLPVFDFVGFDRRDSLLSSQDSQEDIEANEEWEDVEENVEEDEDSTDEIRDELVDPIEETDMAKSIGRAMRFPSEDDLDSIVAASPPSFSYPLPPADDAHDLPLPSGGPPMKWFGSPRSNLLEYRLLSQKATVVREATIEVIKLLEEGAEYTSDQTRIVFGESCRHSTSELMLKAPSRPSGMRKVHTIASGCSLRPPERLGCPLFPSWYAFRSVHGLSNTQSINSFFPPTLPVSLHIFTAHANLHPANSHLSNSQTIR